METNHAAADTKPANDETKGSPDEIISAYREAHKAAETPESRKYEDSPLQFDATTGKYFLEYVRPVPGQRKGLKRPKMETARIEYDEETVLIMTDALRRLAAGERPRFACNPNPYGGVFR